MTSQPSGAGEDGQRPLTGNTGLAHIELVRGPTLSVAAGQTVLEALRAEGHALRQPVILVVNGKTEDFNYRLQAGDNVRLLPQIAGG